MSDSPKLTELIKALPGEQAEAALDAHFAAMSPDERDEAARQIVTALTTGRPIGKEPQ
ncbi:hypothetical protein KSC_024360 [Ktedonobacter sp. SOSP1-52]|uniref:hypothetical protein n=1 Tax=Ktedonobacter sp. SOSP1-52 TaxID=2778366 RepID=UPI0019164324|nr:hypothetical protein [Ktedonobacter sp. SOSP1-52]GHO63544.1 hypothetical protein KSC_024360 [Ktedonobacter sp. SOSP1-52]